MTYIRRRSIVAPTMSDNNHDTHSKLAVPQKITFRKGTKVKMNKIVLLIGFMLGSVAFSGCSTLYKVSDDKLQERTAFALGLDENQITITHREQDGMQTNYNVKTNKGVKYRCYVTGGIAMMGQTSAAMCTKKGEAAKNPLTGN